MCQSKFCNNMCTTTMNYYTTPENEQVYRNFKSFNPCPPDSNIDLYYVLKTADGKWSCSRDIIGRIQAESNELHLPDVYVEDDMTFYLGRSNYVVSLGKLQGWNYNEPNLSRHIGSIDETFNNHRKVNFELCTLSDEKTKNI